MHMLRPVMKATSHQCGSINIGTHSVHICLAKSLLNLLNSSLNYIMLVTFFKHEPMPWHLVEEKYIGKMLTGLKT